MFWKGKMGGNILLQLLYGPNVPGLLRATNSSSTCTDTDTSRGTRQVCHRQTREFMKNSFLWNVLWLKWLPFVTQSHMKDHYLGHNSSLKVKISLIPFCWSLHVTRDRCLVCLGQSCHTQKWLHNNNYVPVQPSCAQGIWHGNPFLLYWTNEMKMFHEISMKLVTFC